MAPIPSKRLLRRIRESFPYLNLSDDAVLRRINPSPSSRKTGAWVWCVDDPGGLCVGSDVRMSELLDAPKLVLRTERNLVCPDVYEYHVDYSWPGEDDFDAV